MNVDIDIILKFNSHTAMVESPFTFYIEELDENFTIPNGFVFDGSSHPRAFNSIIGGRYKPKLVIPSLIHDYLLEETDIERSVIHKRYYEELKRNKVRGAYLYYLAVKSYDYILTKFKG